MQAMVEAGKVGYDGHKDIFPAEIQTDNPFVFAYFKHSEDKLVAAGHNLLDILLVFLDKLWDVQHIFARGKLAYRRKAVIKALEYKVVEAVNRVAEAHTLIRNLLGLFVFKAEKIYESVYNYILF